MEFVMIYGTYFLLGILFAIVMRSIFRSYCNKTLNIYELIFSALCYPGLIILLIIGIQEYYYNVYKKFTPYKENKI